MKRILVSALIGSALLGLSACNDDDNHSPPATGEFRVVNGIPDSGSVAASPTSGNVFNTDGVAFDKATGAKDVPIGSYNLQLRNNSATDSFATVNNVNIDHNTLTALWTRGTIAGGATGFSVEEDIGSTPSGKFTFVFVNDTTSDAAGTLSVYFVPPGTTDLTGITPAAASIDAGKASSAVQLSTGTYEIIVTNGTTPLFDSGATGIQIPPGGNMLQLGALDASNAQVTSNASPLTLMLLDNGNNDSDSKLLLNTVPAT
jgi:hypothetical protein